MVHVSSDILSVYLGNNATSRQEAKFRLLVAGKLHKLDKTVTDDLTHHQLQALGNKALKFR
jgi:hypothetical protein